MITKPKKLNVWRLAGLCLFIVLFLTNTVSAANLDKTNSPQDRPAPPTSYTFEGPVLSDILDTAAKTLQGCNCQNRVANFRYERTKLGWHRLTINLFGITPGVQESIWEQVPFKGTSLPAVLSEAAQYMRDFSCDSAVRGVIYERQTDPANDPVVPKPIHVVYLVLELPFTCSTD